MANLDVLDIELAIGNIKYDNNWAEDLAIDKDNLNHEFMTQSEKFAYYGTLYELAKDRHNRLKNELELVEAHVDAELRIRIDNIRQQDPKYKATEAAIKCDIIRDARYRTKNEEVMSCAKMVGILSIAKEAFQQRMHMLVSLGANLRSNPEMRMHSQEQQMNNVKTMLLNKKNQ